MGLMSNEASAAGSALAAARWKGKTKEERSEVARKLNEYRWGKKRRTRKKGKS